MNKTVLIEAIDLVLVKSILSKHLPLGAVVWVFGSRATGVARSFSDLDLAIDIGEPLSLEKLAGLAHDFDESNLPYKVDVVDWATISEAFRKNIEDERMEIFKK